MDVHLSMSAAESDFTVSMAGVEDDVVIGMPVAPSLHCCIHQGAYDAGCHGNLGQKICQQAAWAGA